MPPAPTFHIRLLCGACGNRTVVNLDGFTAKRAQELDQAIDGQPCGICKAPKLSGRVHPGRSADAKAAVRDGPVTWSPEAVAEMLARSKEPKP